MQDQAPCKPRLVRPRRHDLPPTFQSSSNTVRTSSRTPPGDILPPLLVNPHPRTPPSIPSEQNVLVHMDTLFLAAPIVAPSMCKPQMVGIVHRRRPLHIQNLITAISSRLLGPCRILQAHTQRDAGLLHAWRSHIYPSTSLKTLAEPPKRHRSTSTTEHLSIDPRGP
jgi:hypothetical protein